MMGPDASAARFRRLSVPETLDAPRLEALAQEVRWANADEQVRVIELRGAPGVFCRGMDLTAAATTEGGLAAMARWLKRCWRGFLPDKCDCTYGRLSKKSPGAVVKFTSLHETAAKNKNFAGAARWWPSPWAFLKRTRSNLIHRSRASGGHSENWRWAQ